MEEVVQRGIEEEFGLVLQTMKIGKEMQRLSKGNVFAKYLVLYYDRF